MNTPIIVDENGDLMIFMSVQEAESYLEPVDVRNGEFSVYDCDGRVLRPSVVCEEMPILFGCFRTKIEKVRLSMDDRASVDAPMLRAALINYLRKVGADNNLLSKLSLRELITKVIVGIRGQV